MSEHSGFSYRCIAIEPKVGSDPGAKDQDQAGLRDCAYPGNGL